MFWIPVWHSARSGLGTESWAARRASEPRVTRIHGRYCGTLQPVTSNEDAARPRARFRTRATAVVGPADPEALFGELPRSPKGVGALWSHQADQLREYAREHRDSPDVALELPTGSGKTLVGLLVSEWRRRSLGQRVVYACPTRQLARQVLQKSQDQGIAAVLLIGPHTSWDSADLARYTRGDAVAITTYSAIFNLNSHLSDAQTLVFDDAHAAEGYVAEAWALSVPASLSQYGQLFDALGDALEPAFVERMVAAPGPAADGSEVRLIPVSAVARRTADIARALSGLTGDPSYRLRMLGASLSACLFYVSRQEFYIRPMIPPTFQHQPFTDPTQRVYLSATLGDAGELERAFGRSNIRTVPVPPAWERTGSGRRFFVFPELSPAGVTADPEPPAEAADDDVAPDPDLAAPVAPDPGLVGALMALADKRLILTPDNDSAKKLADLLRVPSDERFTAKDADAGIEPFLNASRGTLLAPSRYDGMDLAADACHLMLMSSLPAASHLQDRFFESKLRAPDILQERVRTRVLQGAGRCTRGPRDWSVVVVIGEDLLRFLSRSEVRRSLPAELQAELTFGFEQSEASADELAELTRSALEQDEVWQEDAEPELARLRREAARTPQPNAAELAGSARREVKAWGHAWKLEWESAAIAAVDVLEHLTAPSTRPYRALWAYLASAWFSQASTHDTSPAAQRSAELLRQAQAAAAGTTWLKEVESATSATYGNDQADDDAVESVLRLLSGRYASATKFSKHSSQMLADLAQQDHTRYENALVTLGTLLGAESFKPSGKGRADAAWLWPTCWITVEAKSEQETEGTLSMDYVRQTNTQLASLAADRDAAIPDGSVSIVVTPRTVVDPDAVPIANLHVYTAVPRIVSDVAHDVVRAWQALRGLALGVASESLREEVARTMWSHRVLPTQVRERLTRDPIRVE